MVKMNNSNNEKLRIVVSGLMASYPFGGVFWDYVQYLLGFYRLGHDVLYIEDTGRWFYNPARGTFVQSAEENSKYLQRHLARLHPRLNGCWFVRDATGSTYGQSWQKVMEFCKTTDLFINISASCYIREEYRKAKVLAFIDTDPMYTQVGILRGKNVSEASSSLKWWKDRHDVFFTFGLSVGQNHCKVPTAGIRWIPTIQPIVMDQFFEYRLPLKERRHVITTVTSWDSYDKPLRFNNVNYGGKKTEFLRFAELPARCRIPFEIAVTGRPPARFLTCGWRIIDAIDISRTPWQYRSYLRNSMIEWSAAKNAYVESKCGWFSCRTSCYLSSAVPAVVQDTGFSKHIDVGQGLFAFETSEEAASAIEEIMSKPQYHCDAAVGVADEYFNSDRVLNELIRNAFASR